MRIDTLPKLRAITGGDLGFHDADSGYATHNFHAFPAKFPPQLPRRFIDALTRPGDLVLDPMVGSGTTLVEAYLAGRAAVGVDIDPLALLLCRVKTHPLPPAVLHETSARIVEAARWALQDLDALDGCIRARYDRQSRDFIDFWFTPRVQRELMALLLGIEQSAPPEQRDFFHLAFSAIIITKSGGVSRARDLAHTRPHRDCHKRGPRDVIDAFARRVRKNIESLADLPPLRAPVEALRGDARTLPLTDGIVDLIVTSPPYASNAIDYMRAHKFSLVWFGQPVVDLSALRGRYVGGERLDGAGFAALPAYAQGIVGCLSAVDEKKGRVLHKYFSEMGAALAEMHRVLKPGGVAIVVAGTSTMRGIDVETPRCLAEIAQCAVGFELIDIAERALDRDRRMMPARANGRAPGIEGRLHQEHVIGLYKPALHV